MSGVDKGVLFTIMAYRQLANILRMQIQRHVNAHGKHGCATQCHRGCRTMGPVTTCQPVICRRFKSQSKNVSHVCCKNFLPMESSMLMHSDSIINNSQCYQVCQTRWISFTRPRRDDSHSEPNTGSATTLKPDSDCEPGIEYMAKDKSDSHLEPSTDDSTKDDTDSQLQTDSRTKDSTKVDLQSSTDSTANCSTSDLNTATDNNEDSGKETDIFYDRNFVSDHLIEMGLNYRDGYTCFLTSCPKHGIRVNKKLPEDKQLFINSVSGYFYCSHCKVSGEWAQIKDNLTALKSKPQLRKADCFANMPLIQEPTEPPRLVSNALKAAHPISELDADEYEKVISMFDWHELRQVTLAAYDVRYTKSEKGYTLLLPVTLPSQVEVYIVKYTATPGPEEGYVVKRSTVPSIVRQGGISTLFGWQVKFPRHRLELVVTSSEVDAMTVYQMTGILTLSLPNLTTFPQAVLPSLEVFTKVTLWIGTSLKDWETAKQFAKKLNNERTYIFRPNTVKELPLEALQAGESFVGIISKALPIGHKSIVQFENLKSDVYKQLANIEMYSGIKWGKYKPMTTLLKGHRRGELTILTGPTGSGKTTFISDYSLDLCQQGVSTLWGSFEISNSRLARVMLTQFVGKNLTKCLSDFEEYASDFEKLPMFYLTFRGEESETKVIEAMHHAVYVHDITHVIVDNLQFMMGMGFNPLNRYFRQDQVVDLFRRFATEMNCHVTLIIHPRKELDGQELTMSSIFGSAKASQEADNVLILQRQKISSATVRTYIQVLKNRFDGTLGVMALKFNKDSVSFTPTKRKHKMDIDIAEEADDDSQDREDTIQHRWVTGNHG